MRVQWRGGVITFGYCFFFVVLTLDLGGGGKTPPDSLTMQDVRRCVRDAVFLKRLN
jgi:hypothetical protein